jgi:hypothetical protein
MAFPSRRGEYPNPSRTIKTRGVLLAPVNPDPQEEATEYIRKPGPDKMAKQSVTHNASKRGRYAPSKEKPVDRPSITVGPSRLLESPDRFQVSPAARI